MPEHRAAVRLDAPARVVWRVLVEVADWPAWWTAAARAEPLDVGVLVPDGEVVLDVRGRTPATWVAGGWTPERVLTLVRERPGLVETLGVTLEDDAGGGACAAVVTWRLEGPAGLADWALSRGTLRRLADGLAADLRRRCAAS